MLPCPACGGTMEWWREAHSSDPALAATPFALERCDRCGTARTIGEAPPAKAHETAYYAPTRGLADRLIEPLRALAERDRMRSVRTIGRDDRVLEIGSGDGRFLAALGRRGADVTGIEPSAEARERSLASGVAALAGGVEDAPAPAEPWRAVILWHSLEHLDRPDAVLRRVRGWIEPGGLLVVAVPNLAGLQARIGGDRWFHQDVPRHRTHFTAAGAVAMAGRSGFDVQRVSHLVLEQNPLGMWQTLLNRLTASRDVAYRALKRDPAVRAERAGLIATALAGPPLVPVAIALELLSAGLRRGGTIVIEARAGGAPVP